MEKFIQISTIIHIVAGSAALLFGALAIFLKKNTPKHKPVGKVYFWSMTIIFITGVYLSIFKNNIFLFLIAFFTYYSVCIAYRALKLKLLNISQKPTMIDWLIEIIAGISFIGMIAFAIIVYFKSHNFGAIIPFVFGSFGLWGVSRNVKRLRSKPKQTMIWLKVHIGNMLGSYIGAITAFIVNQMEHIPLPPIVMWLGPAAILVPIIVIELKKVKSQTL